MISPLSGKDILIVICAGEDVACIGANGDDGTVVLACEIYRSHDQLANSFKYGGRCIAGIEIRLSADEKT